MRKPVRLCLAMLFAAVAVSLGPRPGLAQQVDPYGNCCIAQVAMSAFNTWTINCGSCSANPGQYTLTQPDPAKLVYVGPGGVSADSPYDAALAVCQCPSQDARRAREKRMRTFDGN
ncbi:MAG: hypothetical protein ACP59X_04540 [Solidesulfovibrio sp. DCME]|uniref:hypothetical protein n=1 Tax=Solidesulfovibrio sp. DCME TaxID=3447380 RepID=UPI003D0EBD52